MQPEPAGGDVAAGLAVAPTEQRGERRCEVTRGCLLGELPQRLDPGPGRRGALDLGAAADGDQPALSGELVPKAGEQARLAGPGLTAEQSDSRPARHRLGGRLPKRVQLRLPTDEDLRHLPLAAYRCRRHRWQQVESLAQDGGLHLDQRRARIQSELVGQGRPGPAQRGERVALPTGTPQRQRQQPPALLPQRRLPGQQLRLRHRLGRVAAAHCHVEQQLAGAEPQFLQPQHLRLRPRLTGEFGVRPTAPQIEPDAQQPTCPARVGGADRTRLGEQRLEPTGVDGVGGQPQRVARWRGDQDPGRRPALAGRLQKAAQMRDVRLEGGDRPRRRVTPPQILDHLPDGDDLAAGREQQREHGALAGAAEVDRPACVDLDLKRPEHP
ncbi:hypothetical protein ONO86_00315 [Micromonospora noduli]|nr:hypothetical protein ONO86_00315 [Micromonospora noduli]